MREILLQTLLTLVKYVLYAFPITLLWNSIVPKIFGLTEISYPQAIALYALCCLLLDHSTFTPKSK
jgi:hypothetical protein